MRLLKPITVLRRARKLIENPKNWLQGNYSKSKTGREVSFSSPEACRFCAAGAVRHVASSAIGVSSIVYPSAHDYLVRAIDKVAPSCWGVIGYNDAPGRKHSDILARFDEAIALAKEDA